MRLKLRMAKCVAYCVGIVLSGLQYRYLLCRGGDEDIDHNNGDLS